MSEYMIDHLEKTMSKDLSWKGSFSALHALVSTSMFDFSSASTSSLASLATTCLALWDALLMK